MAQSLTSLLILFALLIVGASSLAFPKAHYRRLYKGQTAFPTKYFTQQRVDHFNPLDNRTWTQRYWENDLYWGGGPVILYINGEGPVYGPPANTSADFVAALAYQLGALVVTLEHRYYGLSVPVPDLSTPNLQYLTTKNALEDLATFLTWYLQQKNATSNPVITYGGSYSGALSAWFRLKYPHLTVGAVASSGVVNAVLDFTAFDQQVATSAGPACTALLQQITHAAEAMIFGSTESNTQIKQLFDATVLTEDGDFFYYIADKMAESVQYGFQDKLCLPLLNAANQSAENLLNIFAKYVTSFAAPELGDAIGYSFDATMNTTIAEDNNWRQWWFQTCAELAYFQNAPAVNSIRSSQINMTYHRDYCQRLFGIFPDTNATNNYYGSNHTAGTEIWFNNGSQDPWQQASVMATLSATEPEAYITCHACGHCVDIVGCPGGCPDGNVALNEGRAKILLQIYNWLNQPRPLK